MSVEKRIVLIEKFKPWDYIDKYGSRIWLNKYGEIFKWQDTKGKVSTTIPYVRIINVENIQHLQGCFGIDIERELIATLAEEIGREIDIEIVRRITDDDFEI